MRFIDTHRTGSALNELLRVQVIDNPSMPDKGGASHMYNVVGENDLVTAFVHFQEGALKEKDSKHGCSDEALIAIVLDRLLCFQGGHFSCEENEEAIHHLCSALDWLRKRSQDRVARGVEGKHEK